MNKFLYFSAAALAGVFATSCAGDEPVADTDGMTTFTVRMPEEMTRAFADGTSAQQLFVAIYDADADKTTAAPLFSNFTDGAPNGMKVVEAGDKKWTVSVNLVKNKSYDLVFWAQNPSATNEAPYTFDAAKRTVTVDYDNMANYAEGRDAFYKHVTYKSSTPDERDITLTRAFAQINIGTTDADLKAYKLAGGVNKFAMSIMGASTQLNLFTDAVSAPTETAVNATPAIAATVQDEENARESLVVNGNDYDYLAMAYVLVGADGTNRDNLTVSLYNQDIAAGVQAFAVYDNVPAQMNYRTNIFGDLLTNPETFNVVIDQEFDTPDILYGIWDGKTVTDPAIDNTAKTVTVSSPDQFAGLAALVKGGNKFEGYTVHIQNSMDFNGFDFPVLFSDATRASSVATGGFRGTIDGHGNTFKNVKIGNALGADNASAVFGAISGEGNGLKNLNFENLIINNTSGEQSGVVGMLTEGATVSNVNVYSGNISGTEGVGSIVGRILKYGTVENCTNNANVSGTGTNVGGIVGAAYYTEIGKEMHVKGCVNTGSVKAGAYCTGGIVGLSAAFIEGCTNEGTVESDGYNVGGITGYQTSAGGIKDCHNKANIFAKTSTVGGIAGLVQYVAGGAYPNMNVITVELCSNSGNIKSEGRFVGGIVGIWNKSGYVKNCTNTAASLQGTQYIAGLVGLQGLSYDTPEGAANTLFVQNNNTTTTLDQMTGADKVLLINHNGYSDVSISGNTPENNN